MQALLNLIKKERIASLERRNKLLDSHINEVWLYLSSSKFKEDTLIMILTGSKYVRSTDN